MDADLLVLKNIDKFFILPQVSAAPNSRMIFNSGVMVIEPSLCMFKELMSKSFKLESYNGGDQDFFMKLLHGGTGCLKSSISSKVSMGRAMRSMRYQRIVIQCIIWG